MKHAGAAARFERDAADRPGTVGILAVGHEHEILAIRRPRRIDRVIVRRIVITRDRALARRDDGARRAKSGRSELGDVEIEVAGARGRNECNAAAVRRIPRLHLHSLRPGELLCLAAGQVQSPEFDRIRVMTRKHDEAAVGRPVGLIVIARAVGQLVGGIAGCQPVDRLKPQRSAHAVHDALPVRRKRHARRAARELRQEHLPIIIRVREIDLPEDRDARGECGVSDAKRQQAQQRQNFSCHRPAPRRGSR